VYVSATHIELHRIDELIYFIFTQAQSPFDLGSSRKNFEAVFGSNPYLWFLPIAAPAQLGDGYFFSPPGGFMNLEQSQNGSDLVDVATADESVNLV
jgi:hypothetical protein